MGGGQGTPDCNGISGSYLAMAIIMFTQVPAPRRLTRPTTRVNLAGASQIGCSGTWRGRSETGEGFG